MVTSIGTFAQNEVLRRRILDTQTEFNRLQVQVSSGKRGANYSSLGENARLSLSLQQSKTVTQTFIQANITSEIRMEQMQSVLERIKTLSNDVRNAALPAIGAATIPAANGNAALKAQANGALLEIAQLLNTQIDGFYLFGGRQSDAPPMVEPGSTGTAGTPLANVSAVAAVAPLANNGASGDTLYDNIVAHLDGTTVGAQPGATPVRYYDGEYSATVESLLITRIDTNTDITYGITGRDDSVNTIMQSLYALSVVDLNPANEAGYRQVINRVIRDLKDGFDGVIEEIGDLGVKQLQLQETTIRQNDFITALDMQIGNVEDVDMSSALSSLTATQTSLEASYRMLTLMRDMTLVKYL